MGQAAVLLVDDISYPYSETVARLNLRTPDAFDHQIFMKVVLDANTAANLQVVEAAVFRPADLVPKQALFTGTAAQKK